jgi:hypothetical protein
MKQRIEISRETGPGGGYDISVYDDDSKIKTAWAYTKNQAYFVASSFSGWYKDENGQSFGILDRTI